MKADNDRSDCNDRNFHKGMTPQQRAERVSRIIVSIMTLLGALGLIALVYFPLHYLQ